MSVEEQLMVTVDRLSADAFREGYLQALEDSETAPLSDRVPERWVLLMEQRILQRHERLTNHSTGAAA